MTRLEEFEDRITDDNIAIEYDSMPRGQFGFYINADDMISPVITIEQQLSSRQRLPILAEEYGHHLTCFNDNMLTMSGNKVLISRQEQRALKWSIGCLIPIQKLAEAILRAGLRSIYEIAEYFEVDEEFARKAVEYYIEKLKNSNNSLT